MQRWIATALVSLLPAAASAVGDTVSASDIGSATDTSKAIPLPPNSKLVGATEVDQIHAFPEMRGLRTDKSSEGVIAVSAVDKVYQVNRPYKDTVKFFDSQFKKPDVQQIERTTTQTATAWTVKMPTGDTANVIVRNTSPTTIEAVQASEAAGEIQEKGMPKGSNKPSNMPMNPSDSNPPSPPSDINRPLK
jgi:hypothetical protein